MRNKVAAPSRHFAEQLLLRNFPHHTRQHFFHARRRRFEKLAAKYPDINLDWDRLIRCQDLRRGAACRMPRTCPYCYVRYLLAHVWRPLQSVCCEIFTSEVDGDGHFDSISHGVKHAAFGCAWTRRWTIGKNNQLVDSATFISPTGTICLLAQEEKFLSIFAVPADFLEARIDDYAEVIRRNLERHTTGKLGIMRKGQSAPINGVRRRLAPRQFLLPPLRDLCFDMYVLIRDPDDFGEKAAPVVREQLPPAEPPPAISPPPLPESCLDFLRTTYITLTGVAGLYVQRKEFNDAVIPQMHAFSRHFGVPLDHYVWTEIAKHFLQFHIHFENSPACFLEYMISSFSPSSALS